MQKLKIALSGAHGTGKSFKVFEFAKDYKLKYPSSKVGIIQENIIDCPLPINKGTTVESQYWIISNQITKEIEYQEKYDIVISDRTVFDPLPYMKSVGLITDSNRFLDFLKPFGQSYDVIYLMDYKTNNYVFSDGLRDIDLEFRNKVGEYFDDIFSDLEASNCIKNLIRI